MELLQDRVRWSSVHLRAAALAFVCLQILLLVLSHVTSPQGPAFLRDQHWRAFDSAQLARSLESTLRKGLNGIPICVVSGPGAIAGALALQLPEHPLVLIDGRYDQSPWVRPGSSADCAVLELRQGPPLTDGWLAGPAQFPSLAWRIVLPAKPHWRTGFKPPGRS